MHIVRLRRLGGFICAPWPNYRVNRTAEQLRCSVPASLRAAAADYPERYASHSFIASS